MKGTSASAKELLEQLDILEKKIDRVKILYEQYFMGIQKAVPRTLHREVERALRDLRIANIRNTAARFRLNSLNQRFVTYRTYWARTMREMEKGTYIRDLKKLSRKAIENAQDIPDEILSKMPKRMRDEVKRARARAESKEKRRAASKNGEVAAPIVSEKPTGEFEPPKNQVHSLDANMLNEDVDFDAMFDAISVDEPKASAAPAPPKRQAAPRARRPTIPAVREKPPAPVRKSTPSQPAGMTEAQTRNLYKKYMQARKVVGDQKGMSYEQLLRTLRKQTPKIMQQHKAEEIDFRVVIKDNKAVLKAKPKKK